MRRLRSSICRVVWSRRQPLASVGAMLSLLDGPTVDDLHNRDVDHLEEFVLVKVLPYVGHLLALLHFLLRLQIFLLLIKLLEFGSSPSIPSSSIVVFIFLRTGHFFLLRFLHVQLEGKPMNAGRIFTRSFKRRSSENSDWSAFK